MGSTNHGRFRESMKIRTSGYFYRLPTALDALTAGKVFELIEAKRSVTPVATPAYFKGSPGSRERVALCVFEIEETPRVCPDLR